MQVTVESPSKIQRRVTVVIPAEKIDQVYDQRIIKLSKTVKLNGFRPGKIPTDIIKKKFGDSARQEALSEVIQSSLYTAMDQEKLSPVGVPTVEPKNVLAGHPLEYIATFEVLPEIDTVHFNDNSFEKLTATIQDEDITKVMEHLRQQNTVWNKVERPAQEKDQVHIDFKGSIDGVPFAGGEAHDYPIVLGSKTMIPGFEEGIVGLGAGEQKSVKVTFQENYFAKEVAGKDAEFLIKVIKVSEPQAPEFDEKFIQKLGVKSGLLADLKVEIKNNLERELARVIKLKLKGQVFDRLLEQNSVEIPKALIEREAERIHSQLHPHHKGHDHGHTEAEMTQFTDSAKRNVTLGLLVGEYVKQNQIIPDKARIETTIAGLTTVYENPEQVAKYYQTNKKARAEIEMQVLEDQVVEHLLQKVQVIEKVVSYTELMTNVQPVA